MTRFLILFIGTVIGCAVLVAWLLGYPIHVPTLPPRPYYP